MAGSIPHKVRALKFMDGWVRIGLKQAPATWVVRIMMAAAKQMAGQISGKNHLHLGLNFHEIRNQDVKSAVIC
jgi:hypothetical protein